MVRRATRADGKSDGKAAPVGQAVTNTDIDVMYVC